MKKRQRKEAGPLAELMPTTNVMVAYDCVRMRPACVLVAAALGADTSVPQLFPIGSWLVSPTDDMAVYNTTPEQLAILIKKTEKAMEETK